MPATAALLLALLSGQARTAVTVTEAQALSRAAPTLSTEGVSLGSARGLRVTLCAASGQTLSGAGALRAYYSPSGTIWSRNSGLDLAVPGDAAGKACWTFPDVEVLVRTGRVLFAADGVTVSGGTTVTLYTAIGL